MSNTTDLSLPEYERLALPASTVMVFVDGTLCDALEPIEIVRGGYPEFGWAKLAYNPAAQISPEPADVEHLETMFAMGRTVCLVQLHEAESPETALAKLPVFIGRIEGIETQIDASDETVTVLAKDAGSVLDRITVYGRHVRQADGSTLFFGGLDTAFNPAGQGNAAPEPVTSEGKTYSVFAADAGDAVAWTCAEAIDYLLDVYVPAGLLDRPGLDQLRILTDEQTLRDLDVTGLGLTEALQRCCTAAGLEFRFEPRTAGDGPFEAIVFYRHGQDRNIELNCQGKGETLNLSRTNIAALRSMRNFYPVTHRHLAQGDFKMFEATFDLVQAWDAALADTDYAKFSPSTNPEFYAVKDVYRKWCLNEAGDYTAAPYNQGAPYDFSRLFEGSAYVRRRRRFWPTLSTDSQNRSLGYCLHVSFDDGLHWWEYAHAFSNLLDECGVWLSSDQLDVDTWVAALKGVLKVRLTASVVSDERLTAIAVDGPVGSTVPVVDHVITLPRRFRYRQVSTASLFAQNPQLAPGTSDEADDTAALNDFVRRRAASAGHLIETSEVQTVALMLHLYPGDRVTSGPDSRDLLHIRRDNRSRTWIDRVRIDCRRQCTELQLKRQR